MRGTWRDMKDDTRVPSARHYIPFTIRQNKLLMDTPVLRGDNFEHMYRLKVAADGLATVNPTEPLYLREISPELYVQWPAYRDSSEGKGMIVKYKQDLRRRPPAVRLSRPRSDDRTLGVVPADTDVSIDYSNTTSVTRVIHVKPKAWSRVDVNGKYIPILRVIEKSLRGIKAE